MKLNTMEEQNPGKYYKNKLKDYESSFDLDSMFDMIDPEINPERKRRPMLFWFWGCGTLAGLLGLLSLAIYLYPVNSHTIELKKSHSSNQQNSNPNLERKENANPLKREIKNEGIKLNNKEIEINNKQEATLEYNGISETHTINKKVNFDSHIEKSDIGKRNGLEFSNKTLFNHLDSVHETINLNITKDFVSVDYLPLINLLVHHEKQIIGLPLIIEHQKRKRSNTDEKNWAFSIRSGYLGVNKSNSFNLTNARSWYENYQSKDEVYPGYFVQVEISRKIKKSMSIISSISHNSWQERNTFLDIDSTSTIDNTLPITIFVDRDMVPIDTVFGQERININNNNYGLVSSYSMTSFGVGMALDFRIGSKVNLSPSLQVIASYFQSKGMILDLEGNLIDRSQLTLNNQNIYTSKMIYGASLGLNLTYEISDNFGLGLGTEYLYNLNSFNNGSALIEKRNLLKINLNSKWTF